jgi:threonine dehydrogenase-like Zn-dependent dehydrogenase
VIINKGLTLRAAQQHGQRYMPAMFEHLQRGELDTSFLITHRMSLEEGPRGYELFKNKEDGCVRAGVHALGRTRAAGGAQPPAGRRYRGGRP